MGRFEAVNNILDVAVLGGDFGLPIASENIDYDETNGLAYLSTFVNPLPVEQASLGSEGNDIVSGLFQISVNYPQSSGMTQISIKCDEINAVFKSGASFTISPYILNIKNVSNGKMITDNGFATIPITIEYYLHTARL